MFKNSFFKNFSNSMFLQKKESRNMKQVRYRFGVTRYTCTYLLYNTNGLGNFDAIVGTRKFKILRTDNRVFIKPY